MGYENRYKEHDGYKKTSKNNCNVTHPSFEEWCRKEGPMYILGIWSWFSNPICGFNPLLEVWNYCSAKTSLERHKCSWNFLLKIEDRASEGVPDQNVESRNYDWKRPVIMILWVSVLRPSEKQLIYAILILKKLESKSITVHHSVLYEETHYYNKPHTWNRKSFAILRSSTFLPINLYSCGMGNTNISIIIMFCDRSVNWLNLGFFYISNSDSLHPRIKCTLLYLPFLRHVSFILYSHLHIYKKITTKHHLELTTIKNYYMWHF